MQINGLFKRIVLIEEALKNKTNIYDKLEKNKIQYETYKLILPGSLVLPKNALFTKEELSECLTFFNIIRRAYIDQVSKILILRNNIELSDSMVAEIPNIIRQAPPSFDLIYFAHSAKKLKTTPEEKEEKSKKYFWPVYFVTGCYAVGISYPFYLLFLEKAKVPTCNLDTIIQSLSSGCMIFAVDPPLFNSNEQR